jgi:hypothetical protein
MSSVVAGMASADVITSETAPATLTGAQEGSDVFKFQFAEFKCNTTKFSGTLSAGSSSSVSLTPTYSGCTMFGITVNVSMNGCSYLVKVNSAVGSTLATVDIVCPAGKEITVTWPAVGPSKCIVHVPAQAALTSASAANFGAGSTKEITLSLNITNIKYSQTAGTGEFGICETKHSTTGGAYISSGLFTGETSSGISHIGIFLS